MRLLALIGLVLCLLGGPVIADSPPALIALDPLNSPAILTDLAPRRPMTGIVQAGTRLVAVGERGHILLSDDDGQIWRQVPVPVSVDLTAVYFATPQKGWAVGHSGVVLVSADAGESWQLQLEGRQAAALMQQRYHDDPDLYEEANWYVSDGADKPFLDVWFETEEVGYVVGAYNLIFKTEDGGRSWLPLFDRTDNPDRLHFYSVRRSQGRLLLAGEQGLLLREGPGNGQFERVEMPYEGSLFGLEVEPEATILYGLRGSLMRSVDGGENWALIDAGRTSTFTSTARGYRGELYLASVSGEIMVSDDQGEHFESVQLEQRFPVTAFVAVADESFVSAGLFGVHRHRLAHAEKERN